MTKEFTLFTVSWNFKDGIANKDQERFLDDFLDKAIEKNGLQFGGGFRENRGSGCIEPENPRMPLIEQHRSLVREWLEQQHAVEKFDLGPITIEHDA